MRTPKLPVNQPQRQCKPTISMKPQFSLGKELQTDQMTKPDDCKFILVNDNATSRSRSIALSQN